MNTRPIVDWLEHRTGIETFVKDFLYEDIPGSSGWHQVLGSMAAFSFMVQALTGILLAFNYAPTPGDAYSSVRYIVTELTGGSLIHGLHHFGASLMIIIVVLHMVQVFVYGAYKKPREMTWVLGCVLLLITMAFGLTGYLLPWDNRAYWGTVVTTQIAGSAPMGSYVQRLMGAENGVGVVTFTRFFAAHVLLLPPLTMILIGVHVYLVRKHGVAPAPDEIAPKKKFYPEQVFKDTFAIFVGFTILFLLAVLAKAPLERIADPLDKTYIPRPEWYFMFLFQLLKFFEGPLEVVGAVILPGLATLALFLVPFIDRGRMVRLRQRTVAVGVVALGAIAWTGLTTAAVMTTPSNANQIASTEAPAAVWQQISPLELAAIGFFRQSNCGNCHVAGKAGPGPDLTKGVHKDRAWVLEHFKKQQATQLKDSQLNSLANFASKLNTKNVEALKSAPQYAVDGAILYQAKQCGACHLVNGVGTQMGPVLNGLAARRSQDWVVQHFENPQKMSPGSTMPPYKFEAKDMDAITKYLLALPSIVG